MEEKQQLLFGFILTRKDNLEDGWYEETIENKECLGHFSSPKADFSFSVSIWDKEHQEQLACYIGYDYSDEGFDSYEQFISMIMSCYIYDITSRTDVSDGTSSQIHQQGFSWIDESEEDLFSKA